MSAIKDAADSIVASLSRLSAAADAILALLQAGPPPDPDLQAAIDELSAASASADAESAKLQAAIPPSA